MTPEQIAEKLKKDGWSLTYTTTDKGGINRSSKFQVTIKRNNRQFTTEFSKGHRVWVKGAHLNAMYVPRKHIKDGKQVELYSLLCPDKCTDSQRKHQQAIFDEYEMLTRPIPPSLDEVISSLITDANCVRFGQSFEDFCGDLCYDSDSRTAEKTYVEVGGSKARMGLNRLSLFVLYQIVSQPQRSSYNAQRCNSTY